MGRRGPPPKPIEQKRRTGNPGKRSLPTEGALAVVPAADPPTMHDLDARQMLDRVLADGVHWLASTDGPRIVMLREQLEERESLRAAVLAGAGDRRQLRDLEKSISESLSKLGFDPAARASLGLAEVKAKSKLEELRERRQRVQAEVVDGDV